VVPAVTSLSGGFGDATVAIDDDMELVQVFNGYLALSATQREHLQYFIEQFLRSDEDGQAEIRKRIAGVNVGPLNKPCLCCGRR
jgi:hypothetical protein